MSGVVGESGRCVCVFFLRCLTVDRRRVSLECITECLDFQYVWLLVFFFCSFHGFCAVFFFFVFKMKRAWHLFSDTAFK